MNKIEKLAEAKCKLKSDFVGLDRIIDQIIDSITPWYLTPEILERPTIISLWGLTGTGKTSLVRKLVTYLGISDKSLFFDCGEQGGDDEFKLFSDKLDSLFEASKIQESDLKELGLGEEPQKMITRMDPLDYTFVFDEFQYLHTKEPGTGNEETRPEGRAVWGLIDSGIIDINRYDYRMKSLIEFIEDIEVFSEEHPGTPIKNGRFDIKMNPLLRQQLSYYRWVDSDVDEEDKPVGYRVLQDDDSSFLFRKLNILRKGLGFEVINKIEELKTLQEFIDFIKSYITVVSKPKVIDCSKSLIFVLGNLDEAFDLTNEDFDPDIDADVYHETTSRVNCMDIKVALRKRFRDEQVGRIGNNIIIYPSLRRCDFEEIIKREVYRISKKFKETSGKEIIVTDEFLRLIYSEGCFPIQGVRPLFSTINTLISPLLSIIMMSGDNEDNRAYTILPGSMNFDSPKMTLLVKTGNTVVGEKEVNLNLGALRSSERCKKIGLQAVHEASHSVLYYLLTGKCPSAIVASNVFGDGGYMMNSSSKDFSVTSIHELRVDVIVNLAGYYGEREFFDPDMCSLGATADIDNVWKELRDAFYSAGLKTPLRYSDENASSENFGFPYGFSASDHEIPLSLNDYFKELCEETVLLVHQEREAIREVSRELCKNRCLGMDVFKDIMERKLTSKPDIPDDDYYTKIINNEK